MDATAQAIGRTRAASAVLAVQLEWSQTGLVTRLGILRRLRELLAERHAALCDAISPELARNRADSLAAEVLPLLEACRFLEREAAKILAPRRLGRRGLPFWLSGIDATVERAPLGTVLIIAPANYALFLPGVQALQALAAGNAVVWKPGHGGLAIAQLFADLGILAGLPQGLLRITDESIEAAETEIRKRPAQTVFTGSAAAGRAVQRLAAEFSIPVIAELSGCDAVLVLPSADKEAVIDALCFGMRLNGSATCMAPRRLLLIGGNDLLLNRLQIRFAAMDAIFLAESRRTEIEALLEDATLHGALVTSRPDGFGMKPILVRNGSAQMKLAQTDLFAPILTAICVENVTAAVALERQSAFGLTAAVFGDEREARAVAAQLEVGTVLINDLIVPTADPRVPFGGRKASGFGTTRGAEGLLAMTAAKTVSVRRSRDRRHYQPTTGDHEALFSGVIALSHQREWTSKFAGLRKLIAAAKKLSGDSR